jgi:hypothetical protein
MNSRKFNYIKTIDVKTRWLKMGRNGLDGKREPVENTTILKLNNVEVKYHGSLPEVFGVLKVSQPSRDKWSR